ncbi:MAG: hypothetical protein KGS72_18330 [Cyanobacteria bacterium REEB67]|nr:hypothetical protein [Cyanobacteria bacterium REEB67]
MQYIAFNLTENSRKDLLTRINPRFSEVYCEHITHIYGVSKETDSSRISELMPVKPKTVRAYAYSTDALGVEALLIEIDGVTLRPDGKPYHLTISLAEGRRQMDSNTVIEQYGSKSLAEPIELEVIPSWND